VRRLRGRSRRARSGRRCRFGAQAQRRAARVDLFSRESRQALPHQFLPIALRAFISAQGLSDCRALNHGNFDSSGQQVTKVELFINLKTAKTLGIALPLPLIGRADQVIE
jgi:hypothetical protein